MFWKVSMQIEKVQFYAKIDNKFCTNRCKCSKDSSITDLVQFCNGIVHWNFQFLRCMQDWEFESLSNCKVGEKGEDRLCWKPAKSRGFEVGGYYNSLVSTTTIFFPWKIPWKSKVLPRVVFFSRTVALGRILTMDNLVKRQIIVTKWYYMCKNFGELVD